MSKIKPVENTWSLQGSKRAKGTYFQAVYGRGRNRLRVVTLGYLTREEAEDALAGLRFGGDRLAREAEVVEVTTETGSRYEDKVGYTDDQIRRFSLDPAGRGIDKIDEAWGREAKKTLLKTGDYSNLPLRTYAEEIYRPVRRAEVAASTTKNEDWYWTHILPALGHVTLSRIDGVKIEQFLLSKTAWKGPTKRLALNTIRCVLRHAVEAGVLADQPATRRVKDAHKRIGPKPVPLSATQLKGLLDNSDTPMHRALYAYACGLGTRKSEAPKLDWSDLRWEQGEVHVRGTKTEGSDRVVTLPPLVVAELGAYWRSQGCPTSGPAFTWNGKPFRAWQKGFKGAARRAGVTSRVSPGIARHTFVTLAQQGGVPKATTKQMIGHSERSHMIDDHYDHPTPEMVSQVMRRFDPLGVFESAKVVTPAPPPPQVVGPDLFEVPTFEL
jgi:integrase